MAEVLGKDPATYSREHDGFLRDLQHFNETRGTPFRRAPTVGGKTIDLYLLYNLVIAQGGWIKVNVKNSWSELLPYFQLPSHCVNGSVALKQIYLRHLDRWEKVHFLGEEGDRGSDDDEESRHKRWSARSLHSVPCTYNYSQHNITETNRELYHLSTEVYKSSDYDRLALSLISPLPNEQDFAINVCTLLSNDGKHTLKVEKHPRIINFLLGHAGVFNHSSMRNLFMQSYNAIRGKSLNSFWLDALESREFLDLTAETKFEQKPASLRTKVDILDPLTSTYKIDESIKASSIPGVETMEVDLVESTTRLNDNEESTTGDLESSLIGKLKLEPQDEELFCVKRTLGTQDYVGQRVLQIATIMRNLSYIDENLQVLVQNKTYVRFLLLCASSQWSILKNLGLDMLGNVASEFILKDITADRLSASLLKIVARGLESQDRASCISSLEVLNKLSQNELNEDALLRSLEANVYEKVCSFLTIHDVMLLIYTLECLYSLTSLGERSCSFIVSNHCVVDTLVSLVTVEGKSYGPKACIGMKLVETVPSGHSTSTQANQSPAGSTTSSGTSSNVASSANTTVSTAATLTPIAPASPTPKSNTTTPLRVIGLAPTRLNVATPVSSSNLNISSISTATTSTVQTLTPQQSIQQQHAHQQTIHENEQFALAWLRATYEPAVNGRVDHQELYKHYLSSCSRIGRRGVISPLHFPRCVRSVFGGTVGPNPGKTGNSADHQFYEGIKVMAHPHLSQALLGTPSKDSSSVSTASTTATVTNVVQQSGQSTSTSLIKSLLANKVNECMAPSMSMRTASDCQNVAQVAARQRLLAQQSGNATPDNQKGATTPISVSKQQLDTTPKTSRANGVRQLFNDNSSEVIGDPSVSSTTQCSSTSITTSKGKKEPPQPPPPPLAPLSNNIKQATNSTRQPTRLESEDSDSIGNNSLASSTGLGTVGLGGISSTEDADNSLTSFEGLLNGIPTIDNPLNEDSNNSKDSVKLVTSEISMNKPLRLADLLEKKIEKAPPSILNGVLSKEKNVDLVENHIEKALNRDNDLRVSSNEEEEARGAVESSVNKLKRSASDDIVESDAKKSLVASLNGNESPAPPDSVSSSNGGEDLPATVSTAAAKLFADIAADILEDEDEEQLMQVTEPEPTPPTPVPAVIAPPQPAPMQQIIVDNNQQMLLTQPRQIIVSQPTLQATSNQMVITTAGTTMKTQTGQTVIVQNPAQQRSTPVVIQPNTGQQFLLSQNLQGQVQLVASSQPGQYVIQTSSSPGTYMVAQPQTAVVHGQPQTVLVAQTSQQQGTGTKTIIILQQQPNNAAGHHQKVMMTPQGQQVVVTQMPRPVIQSAVSNNVVTVSTQNTKTVKSIATPTSSTTVVTVTTNQNGIAGDKEEKTIVVKPKIVRDLTTPFVCEWGDCNIEKKFKSANDVYLHVCDKHCPTGSEEIVCQWDRCDNMKRKRFSLMTHLHDKHCNTEAMRLSLVRRKQAAQGGKVDTPAPTTTTPHPGYAPDAALHAIKRHALEFVNPKELQLKVGSKQTVSSTVSAQRTGPAFPSDQDDNEGPVTKSIRLTASLILRNLVIYSNTCRRYLKHYEPHLANVALSNVESSRTIAQVLYDMNEGSNLR